MSRQKCLPFFSFLILHVLMNFVCLQKSPNHCFTPDEHNGQCVEISQCELINQLRHKDPQTHRDRLFVSLSLCGFKNNQPLVCCSSNSTYPKDSLYGNLTANNLMTLPRKNNQLPDVSECASAIEDRIFGGVETKVDEFPFSALLIYLKALSEPTDYSFNCGGSLINNKFVLTAGHCVHSRILTPRKWTLKGVRLGEWNLQTNPDCGEGMREDYICAPPFKDYAIEQQIIHDDFNQNNHNDIALLKLDKEVEFNKFVRPICLPMSQTFNTDSLNFIVTGFGKTESGLESQIKLKTDVSGTLNADCQNSYERRQIVESQLCAAGIDGKDSCTGDSGNGLIYMNTLSSHAHWVLLGITSYGPNPCGQDIPGIYTRITKFIPWIVSKI